MNNDYHTGMFYFKSEKWDKAISHLVLAADQEDLDAKNKLIELFDTHNDLGESYNDPEHPKFINFDPQKVIGNYRFALFIARKSRKLSVISKDKLAELLFTINGIYYGFRYLYAGNNKHFENKQMLYLKESAKLGNADAQYDLGYEGYYCGYYADKGLETDDNKAAYWLIEAAKQNHPEADSELGCRYGANNGEFYKELNKDMQNAINVFEDRFNNYIDGKRLIYNNKIDEAMKCFELSADQGYLDSKCFVEFIHYARPGIDQDLKTTFEWIRESTEVDDSENRDEPFMFGLMYKYGYIVGVNKDKSDKWFQVSLDNDCHFSSYE